MRFAISLAFGMFASCGIANAQLNDDFYKPYIGSYSGDCSAKETLTVTLAQDGLSIHGFKQKKTFLNPVGSVSKYGPTPPKGFIVSILAESSDGSEVEFELKKQKNDVFANVEIDPKAATSLGIPGKLSGLRLCKNTTSTANETQNGKPVTLEELDKSFNSNPKSVKKFEGRIFTYNKANGFNSGKTGDYKTIFTHASDEEEGDFNITLNCKNVPDGLKKQKTYKISGTLVDAVYKSSAPEYHVYLADCKLK